MGKKNIVWNDYISQNERFADFFNGVLFQGKQIVLPENLTELNTKLWRKQQGRNSYHEYIRDVVKLWEYKEKKYILGLEPEELPHYALPVKYLNYESLEYDRQYKEILKEHRKKCDLLPDEYLSGFAASDRLIPIVTLGVYLGEKTWSGFTRLSEMIGIEEIPFEIRGQIVSCCNEFHSNLLNIHALETSDIFRTDLREVFGFLKRQGDKEKLVRYVEENDTFRHLKEDAFEVLCTYSEAQKLAIRKEECWTERGINMCTAIRELMEDAREEGRIEVKALNELIYLLVNEGRIEDLGRASKDSAYQKQLMEQYGISGYKNPTFY